MVFEQNEFIAIDILLNPSNLMVNSAKAFNSCMRQNYPEGFELDSNRIPHISVVQAFVYTEDLDKVFSAVENVVKEEQPITEKLAATGLEYKAFKNLGVAGITIEVTSKLLSFQAKLIGAIKPYTGKGTDKAFFPNKDGSEIRKPTVDYVNTFESEQTGNKYNPHVTIGVAQETFVKKMMEKEFKVFTFKSESVSIYQLGDWGTAQRKIWSTE